MTKLSVNVNKVATLRNARPQLNIPSVLHCAKLCVDAGAQGITVHPRPDQRHIRPQDVYELAELLRIVPLLDRLPAALSGGEAQRVALGRALAAKPKILLLDEPLNALDDETWEGMIALLGQIRKATGVTTLHVTHRREEARRLADKVFVLADGAVRPAVAQDLQEQQR